MDRKQQKEHFLKIAQLVDTAGSEYAQYLINPTDHSRLETISKLERDGDRLEEELNAHYSSQRNIPYLSLDRAKLLRRLDEILDQILLASKTLDAFGSALPNSFSDEAKELSEHVDQMTTSLHEAIDTIYEDFQKASEMTKTIEYERDIATDLLFNLEKSFFQADETSDNWKSFIAISRIARRTISIINATKSASEVLEIMAMKYV